MSPQETSSLVRAPVCGLHRVLVIGGALGKIKLKDLNPVQVRWFYKDRLDSGLAPVSSVHKLHVVLHKALKAAVGDGLIPRNAARPASSSRSSPGRR